MSLPFESRAEYITGYVKSGQADIFRNCKFNEGTFTNKVELRYRWGGDKDPARLYVVWIRPPEKDVLGNTIPPDFRPFPLLISEEKPVTYLTFNTGVGENILRKDIIKKRK